MSDQNVISEMRDVLNQKFVSLEESLDNLKPFNLVEDDNGHPDIKILSTNTLQNEYMDIIQKRIILAAKGQPATSGIFFISSRHVETVCLLEKDK